MSKGGSFARIAPGILFPRNIYSRNNLPQSIISGRKIPQEFFFQEEKFPRNFFSGKKIPDFLRNVIPGQEFRFLNFFADFYTKKKGQFLIFFQFFFVDVDIKHC